MCAFPISVGSGATLASNLLNGEHLQLISPVSIYPLPAGANFIGLATVVPGTAFPVTDNSGSLTVDWISGATVSVAALPNVTIGAALPAGANFIGLATAVIGNTPAVTQSGTWNVGITGLTSLASGTKIGINPGENYIGLASVNIGGTLPALSVGGNFIGLATVVLGANAPVVGAAAHDAAVSGNPVLAGGEGRDTLGTAVTSGDAVRALHNRYGMQVIAALPPSHVSSNGTPITATTTTVIAAPSAGNHLRIVRFFFSNGGSTASWVAIRDGASGTQHYRAYLMQGSAVTLDLNVSGPLDLTTATRLDIVMSAAGSVEYEIDYFTVAD